MHLSELSRLQVQVRAEWSSQEVYYPLPRQSVVIGEDMQAVDVPLQVVPVQAVAAQLQVMPAQAVAAPLQVVSRRMRYMNLAIGTFDV